MPMVVSLMLSQFLNATVSLPFVVGAAKPGAVVSDVQVDGLHVTLEIVGASESCHAEGAWSAVGDAKGCLGGGECSW